MKRKAKSAADSASVEEAEHECRQALMDEWKRTKVNAAGTRFRHFKKLIEALPTGVERANVYRHVTAGIHTRKGWKLLDPVWCRDRDDALRNLKRDIAKLKDVLRRSPWGDTAAWADGVESEFLKLVESDGNRTKPFLTLSRTGLGWTDATAGRPREAWRTETAKALRAEGVPRREAESILTAAHLIKSRQNRRP